LKDDFFTYQAQTSPHPLALEVSHAKGNYIIAKDGTEYLDFVAGVSACSLGHRHPRVVEAIKEQLDKYLHVMVYGEYIQEPAVSLTKLLASLLPKPLEKTYLTNSGTEAIEGALKLAKRVTGRSKIIAAKLAYHGNTMGAMSVMGYEERKQAYRPLIPDTYFISFNNDKDLENITVHTAAVILETIQGGAGFILPEKDYLKRVKQRCDEVGALLILDEIQPGFGRTGKLFGFEHYDIVPDILVMGKGMGGGLPIGAFTASSEMMNKLQDAPKLGHITTFGGNAVIASAALATLQEITESDLMAVVDKKEALIRSLLNQVILECQKKGLILFWLLFEPLAVRITPPLTISETEIKKGCQIIISVLNSIQKNLKIPKNN